MTIVWALTNPNRWWRNVSTCRQLTSSQTIWSQTKLDLLKVWRQSFHHLVAAEPHPEAPETGYLPEIGSKRRLKEVRGLRPALQ